MIYLNLVSGKAGATHGVGVQAHGEGLGQFEQAVLYPGLAVFEGAAGDGIGAAEEGAAYATGDAVVEARTG